MHYSVLEHRIARFVTYEKTETSIAYNRIAS